MKKVVSLLLVMVMIFSMSIVSLAETDTVKITIVHTNDTHTRVESSSSVIGFSKIATYVKMLKEQNPNVLLLDAGDTLHGQTIATLSRGMTMVDILNATGYDAMAPGNHDFNYGQNRLNYLRTLLNFPVISANVYKYDGELLLPPYVIKEVEGVKVGIFGLTTTSTAYQTHPNNVTGMTFGSPVEHAKKMVEALEGKVDIIIALGHIGVDASSEITSRDIIKAVDGIDLFIDGHSHTKLRSGEKVNDTLLVQTGEYAGNLGVVDMYVQNGELYVATAKLIPVAKFADVKEDAAVKAVVDAAKAENNKITEVVVGNTDVKLEGARDVVRAGESNLGNMITNAMLYESGAQIAFTNGGGIRTSIEAGPITKGNIITVLPFGNIIVTKNIKGSDIIKAIENGITDYPATKGAFPHVAGIKITFDPAQPAQSRVTPVTFNGAPLDPEAMYLVATNDFMAAGGDGYTMFKDYPIAGLFSSLDEALIKYIATDAAKTVEVEGRITAE